MTAHEEPAAYCFKFDTPGPMSPDAVCHGRLLDAVAPFCRPVSLTRGPNGLLKNVCGILRRYRLLLFWGRFQSSRHFTNSPKTDVFHRERRLIAASATMSLGAKCWIRSHSPNASSGRPSSSSRPAHPRPTSPGKPRRSTTPPSAATSNSPKHRVLESRFSSMHQNVPARSITRRCSKRRRPPSPARQ